VAKRADSVHLVQRAAKIRIRDQAPRHVEGRVVMAIAPLGAVAGAADEAKGGDPAGVAGSQQAVVQAGAREPCAGEGEVDPLTSGGAASKSLRSAATTSPPSIIPR
jgi:hypothetical protein